ncbi:PAP2 superfamily protein [Tolypothrix tenuis PCC 7101]|uniref:PAP2 superfamily protein n=1 Tax=Tolypothrix tenuis PCC 7101 TaxID=231146 RepID=A0A1Z4MRN9_9CYAN|nr:phosphatase PAP2 family protein [Aulosira sp. FACHB-113]BAY96128.1 PAP2 superfamily protein [Tolypothrix tenuis PCC 7101]BAZ73365.1 PAP2 superfamily protein [Aulosira laxa NIES-50]
MFNSAFWRYSKSFLTFLWHLVIKRRAALVILFIGVFLPLQIFGELAEEVWEKEGGFAWDVPILLAIHSTAQPQLDTFASTLTKLGVFWGVFPVASAIALALFIRRKWRKLAYLLTTLLGSIIINRTAKVLLHRVRPHLWESPAPEFDYGFPSGHAMSSMTLVVALVILTWGSRWSLFVLIVGGIFVLAIGWTRLYLGVHYPSDILAGWTASIAWATGVSLLIRPYRTKRQQ